MGGSERCTIPIAVCLLDFSRGAAVSRPRFEQKGETHIVRVLYKLRCDSRSVRWTVWEQTVDDSAHGEVMGPSPPPTQLQSEWAIFALLFSRQNQLSVERARHISPHREDVREPPRGFPAGESYQAVP